MLVCFVSMMHILWGMLLLLNQAPIETVATQVLRLLVHDSNARALIYIVAGLLPLTLLRWPGSVIGLFSVAPQQVLLIMSGISALVAIVAGQYADGVVRPHHFIAADQGIYLVLAVLHAFETLDRFHERKK